MTLQTDIKTAETKAGVFLSAHHIVLYVLLIGVTLTGVYLIESKIASLQEARAQAAEQALAVEKDNEAKLTQAFQQAQAQRDAQNAQFLQTIAQLQAQVKVQIVHDKALPAPELGHRIEDITGFKRDTITLDPSQDLIVPLPLGQEIVAKLDQGLADAQTVVQQAGVIKNQADTIVDQAGIIKEDKIVLAKQIKSDGDVLQLEKDNCRKSKWKWFAAGAVFGFIGREILKP